ncbi:MAG: M64 family metallopeptidase [Bacteroidales bacterium]|nr:M64 family metallopeptidase [Bacteroidales bacterium]
MRNFIIFISFCGLLMQEAFASFDDHFENATLRFDFFLSGNKVSQQAIFEKAIRQEGWSGNPNSCIPSFDYGEYCIQVRNEKDDQLLFSKGFSTLFQEWRTTPEASLIQKTSLQTQLLPFPKHAVRIDILERNPQTQQLNLLLRYPFDPHDQFVVKEAPFPASVTLLHGTGETAHAVDLSFVAEGYTIEEKDKFLSDVSRLTDCLFRTSPYNMHKECFNVRAVFSPSLDQGPDIPGSGIWKRSLLGSTFDTFGTDRYLTVPDAWRVWDVLSGVPSDVVYVLTNTDKYGGGGIYNFLSVGISDHAQSESVFLHELGHGFAGLGDEYYESSVSYEEFYSLKVEPWEPNITTLVDFNRKWADMLPAGIQIPTPVEAAYNQTVGLFEGGGYVAKGIFRPYDQCRMRSNKSDFCPVCVRAIEKMIKYYCE